MSYQDQEQYIESLAQYIRDNITQHSMDELRAHLRSNGHAEDAIDQAILKA